MGAGLTVNLSTSEWYAAGLEEFLERGIFVEPGSKYMYERVRETDSDFRIFDLILLLTGVLAGLGIANNLVLSAHVRRREIALLRVLGMKASQVFGLFLVEGLFMGALGGIMAVVLGIPLGFLSLGALELISAFDVQFDLPLSYPVYILISAIAIAVGSALYPALRAARQSSAESVHYE
jgi:putative ABC transport system permease protein